MGHLFVGLKDFPEFFLACEPGHADKLTAQQHQGRGAAFVFGGTVARQQGVPALQPPALLPAEGLRQHRSGGVDHIVDADVPLGQFKIQEAPLVAAPDQIAGAQIPVDDLPGQALPGTIVSAPEQLLCVS